MQKKKIPFNTMNNDRKENHFRNEKPFEYKTNHQMRQF